MNTRGEIAQPKTQNPTVPTKLPTTNHPTKAPPPTLRRRVPPPNHRENRRQCCSCTCCCMTLFWTALIATALVAATAVAAAAFYAYYRPRPPSFFVSSLMFTHLNLTANATSAAETAAKMNLTVTASNPNGKITFLYHSINVTVAAHRGKIIMGRGNFPQFVQWGKNSTELFAQIESGEDFGDKDFGIVKSDLKNKKGLDLKVEMETQMRLKIGERMKTGEFGLRVSCSRINAFASSNRNLTDDQCAVEISVDGAKCDVYFIIAIFEWEISFSTKI